jgi:hypothetical protein
LFLLFRRKTGDGRYLLLLWLVLWGILFMFPGGKFARYVMTVLPAVMITAAIGVQFAARKLGSFCGRVFDNQNFKVYPRAALASLVIITAFWTSVTAAPHYRLYVNQLGGGPGAAGKIFPQDEFYDAYIQNAMIEIAKRARPNARVANESPAVAEYYAQRASRPDLISVEFSDPAELAKLQPSDFVIDGRGRTYVANQASLTRLRQSSKPAFTISVGSTPAADVYILTQQSLDALRAK